MKTLVSYYFEEEEKEIVKDTQGLEPGQIQVSAAPLRTVLKAWDSDMPPFNSEPTVQSLLGPRFPWLARGVVLCDMLSSHSFRIGRTKFAVISASSCP